MDQMTNQVSRAEALARTLHDGEQYGSRPKIDHPAAVVGVLCEFGWAHDEQLIAAGWLHDIVEDTDYTIRQVREAFGDGVANLVWAVTGQGESRKQRNADAYRKLRAMPGAVVLKLADRIANVRACIADQNASLSAMYCKEWPEFQAALEGLGSPPMWETLQALMVRAGAR